MIIVQPFQNVPNRNHQHRNQWWPQEMAQFVDPRTKDRTRTKKFWKSRSNKILKNGPIRSGPWYWWSVDPWFYFELKTSLEWRKFTLIISQFHRVWQTSLNLDKLYKSEAYSRFNFLDLRLLKIVQNSRTFKIIQDYKLQSRNKCYSVNHEFIRKLSLSLKKREFSKITIFIKSSKTVFHQF